MTPANIAFQGELMLLNWSESSNRGRTVTFLLGEEGDSHPFRDATIKNGKRAGQRYMAVLVQLDESEQPVQQEQKLSNLAGMLCRDPLFWRFASERSFDTIDSEDGARVWLLAGANITSRSQLDAKNGMNPAADWFRSQVLVPFEAYRQRVTAVKV